MNRLVTLVAALLVVGAGSQATAGGAAANARWSHCVAEAHEVTEDAVAPPSVVRCFSTFAGAVDFATDGRVRVDASSSLAEQRAAFDAAMLNPVVDVLAGSRTVLGADYWDSSYGGPSLLWTTTNSAGCANGAVFTGTMNAAWNDAVSSAKSYQGCSFFGHYEHSNWSGAVIDCGYSCSYIGDAMNDRTSSVRFRRS